MHTPFTFPVRMACKPFVAPMMASAALWAAFTVSSAADHSATYQWTLGAPVLDLSHPASGAPVKLLDPCAVRDGGRWHFFAGSMYFALDSLKPGAPTPQPVTLPVGGAFVPQVFYFRPTRQWQWIGQQADTTGRYPKNVVVLSTNARIDDPQGWSKPVILDVPPPDAGEKPLKSWMDFYIICDDAKAHLFATGGGRLWRSETSLANYPRGWSKPVVALEGNFLYASHTYRIESPGKPPHFWMNLTAATTDPATNQRRQYQQSYVADRIEGPWRAEFATADAPLAGMKNIRTTGGGWNGDIVHGEPLREGSDERMILEPGFNRFIFHGGYGEAKTPCVGVLELQPNAKP